MSNSKPGPKRTTRQREHDLQEIAELYLKGWYQSAIADHIIQNRDYEISQQQVSYDIKAIHTRWLNSSLVDYNEAKAKEIAKIDLLEQTYWSEYLVSKEPVVKRKTAKKVDGQTTEATQEISLGTGDPRFLQGVQWCVDRRVKLLGLDAPIKQQVTASIETKTIPPDFSQLTDDELESYINLADKLNTSHN